MSSIIFYLTVPFLYLASLLPFRVLYLLSDILYLLVYRVFAYRKNVVLQNLRNSFPEKPANEIDRICRDFYHHLCDLIVETIKLLTISRSTLKKHVQIDDYSLLERYLEEKQSVILVLGHLGNWEMVAASANLLPVHRVFGIYHPLENRHFDRLMIKMRTRLGGGVYSMKQAYRGMLQNRNEVTATGFIADQTPGPGNAHWMTLLNQDTAVFRGTEVIARKFDYPVIYVAVTREKRGFYSVQLELMTEHPKSLAEGELTELHTRRFEQNIIKNPEIWLWSHRRWKHKKPATPDP